MASKKSNKNIFITIFSALASLTNIINKSRLVVRYDAEHAIRQAVAATVLMLLSTVFFLSTWLCCMIMLGIYLLSINMPLLSILFFVFILNLLLLAFTLLSLLKLKKKPLFTETRRLITQFYMQKNK